jgi:hypothetical protein
MNIPPLCEAGWDMDDCIYFEAPWQSCELTEPDNWECKLDQQSSYICVESYFYFLKKLKKLK